GLIPAAGRAARISPLPCSKELYPVALHVAKDTTGATPRVVSHYLLEKMSVAGISKAFFVLRHGKWDIPAYFGDGSILKMHLGYLTLQESPGVPFTLDHAYPFVRHARVAFGFPDILLNPKEAFQKMLQRQQQNQPDVVLGLWRTRHEARNDVVDFDEKGIVRD